jgi:hypothetical protein
MRIERRSHRLESVAARVEHQAKDTEDESGFYESIEAGATMLTQYITV